MLVKDPRRQNLGPKSWQLLTVAVKGFSSTGSAQKVLIVGILLVGLLILWLRDSYLTVNIYATHGFELELFRIKEQYQEEQAVTNKMLLKDVDRLNDEAQEMESSWKRSVDELYATEAKTSIDLKKVRMMVGMENFYRWCSSHFLMTKLYGWDVSSREGEMMMIE